MKSEPPVNDFSSEATSSGPKIVVKKKGQKYGQGYTGEDG